MKHHIPRDENRVGLNIKQLVTFNIERITQEN